ncbi:conjugative transposon protein TraN [Chitinophaga pollutisoli]|uniref:Conjugative transposon protein TraN n=1 Tax=Chitinophaga pollutisoli TaxID=3133966 RepID=A0ABZ2YQC7_9BACT
MKTFISCCLMLLLTGSLALAQPSHSDNIRRYRLSLSTDQTTVLVFATPICEGCVDRGHPDIATEMVTGMKNVLRVKARTSSLPLSNLTVITEDGKIYAFTVDYNTRPSETLWEVEPPLAAAAQFSHERLSDASISKFLQIMDAMPAVKSKPATKTPGKMRMSLADLYQKGDVLFFKFQISNSSGMDYDLNLTRYYVRDKKRAKRTAKLEKPLAPLAEQRPDQQRVNAGRKANLVVAFPKFTIANNKLMVVEIFEHNGDRPITLMIRGHQLLSARGE